MQHTGSRPIPRRRSAGTGECRTGLSLVLRQAWTDGFVVPALAGHNRLRTRPSKSARELTRNPDSVVFVLSHEHQRLNRWSSPTRHRAALANSEQWNLQFVQLHSFRTCSQVEPQQVGFIAPLSPISSKLPWRMQHKQTQSPSVSSAHSGQRSPYQSPEYSPVWRHRVQVFCRHPSMILIPAAGESVAFRNSL